MNPLDEALLDAHAQGDGLRLVQLYARAADEARDEDARSFYLTHAYIFALETGDTQSAPDLRARLVDMGRETPLHGSATI